VQESTLRLRVAGRSKNRNWKGTGALVAATTDLATDDDSCGWERFIEAGWTLYCCVENICRATRCTSTGRPWSMMDRSSGLRRQQLATGA